MEEHLKRVVIDKSELDTKIARLSSFAKSDVFKGLPEGEQDLLTRQLCVMQQYSDILKLRLS